MGGSDGERLCIGGQGFRVTHTVCSNGQRGGLGQVGQVVHRVLEARAKEGDGGCPWLSREGELTETLVKPWSLVCDGSCDAYK